MSEVEINDGEMPFCYSTLVLNQEQVDEIYSEKSGDDIMAYKEAVRLACVLQAKHYPELKEWRPLDDLRGVISQIDNLTCGLVKERY